MAELGSHQLDACSIFLGKKHPLAVTGIGGTFFYTDGREVDDHVFTVFEFPGKGEKDRVVVTYSSINTNSFDGYGEMVMGSKGTMIVSQEKEILLYKEAGSPITSRTTSVTRGDRRARSRRWRPARARPARRAAASLGGLATADPSRGYREELEHFAYCVRHGNASNYHGDNEHQPRCRGEVALADAVIALDQQPRHAAETPDRLRPPLVRLHSRPRSPKARRRSPSGSNRALEWRVQDFSVTTSSWSRAFVRGPDEVGPTSDMSATRPQLVRHSAWRVLPHHVGRVAHGPRLVNSVPTSPTRQRVHGFRGYEPDAPASAWFWGSSPTRQRVHGFGLRARTRQRVHGFGVRARRASECMVLGFEPDAPASARFWGSSPTRQRVHGLWERTRWRVQLVWRLRPLVHESGHALAGALGS